MRKVLVGLIVGAMFAAYAAYFRGPSRATGAFGDGQDTSRLPTTNSAQTTAAPPPSAAVNPPPSPAPNPTPTPTLSPPAQTGLYRNGTYNGSVEDAFYGNIQVQVAVSGGKIASVKFLQYPNDRDRTIEINNYAMPILSRQAIDIQGANVDGVSGATDTSDAFIASLRAALSKAKA